MLDVKLPWRVILQGPRSVFIGLEVVSSTINIRILAIRICMLGGLPQSRPLRMNVEQRTLHQSSDCSLPLKTQHKFLGNRVNGSPSHRKVVSPCVPQGLTRRGTAKSNVHLRSVPFDKGNSEQVPATGVQNLTQRKPKVVVVFPRLGVTHEELCKSKQHRLVVSQVLRRRRGPPCDPKECAKFCTVRVL
mmetsp:Transcript_21161/g.50332  ORF Transcript_21161/g.50332 Transcript_21161/m.50332 type:complete len:189 (+) Transcript_21161:30-596(+)